MHVHPPKPIHGWRAFIGEIGVIVIGVLIALGAENLVERWRWHERVEQTDEAIKEELAATALYAWERHAVQPCLRARIAELSRRLNSDEPRWAAAPSKLTGQPDYVMPVVYRAPNRPLYSDAWQDAIASGAFGHFARQRASGLSGLYGQIAFFNALTGQEDSAATKLAPLAFDRRLTARDRLDMTAALADVDRINAMMDLIGGQIVEQIRALRFGFDRRAAEQARKQTLAAQRAFRGSCVSDVPLDLD